MVYVPAHARRSPKTPTSGWSHSAAWPAGIASCRWHRHHQSVLNENGRPHPVSARSSRKTRYRNSRCFLVHAAEFGRASGGVVNTITKSGPMTSTAHFLVLPQPHAQRPRSHRHRSRRHQSPKWRPYSGRHLRRTHQEGQAVLFFDTEAQRRNFPWSAV